MGSLILDRFRVDRRIGAGGFGTVYCAWDERLEREVALKAIETGDSPGDRVTREAQAAARLNHPGIVTLYEFGEENGTAYLVSELIDGPTLKAEVLGGEMSDLEVAEIGADLCEALDYAHSRGVIHRDIKPQNVLISDGDSVTKLMDFGIARLTDGVTLTSPGDVLGTLAYMSPEQSEGRAAGPEADVYSLALTLYECWTGSNPNVRDSPAATVRAIGRSVPDLGRVRRSLPAELTETIDACLVRQPADRPTLEELGTVIERSIPLIAERDDGFDRHGLGLTGLRPEGGAATSDLLVGCTLAVMTAVPMLTINGGGPIWGLAFALAAGLLGVILPRLGFLTGAIGVTLWLALGGEMGGAALVVVLLTLPCALLLQGRGGALASLLLAPILGPIGAAPLFPFIAALAGTWRDRVLIALTGYSWVVVGEVVSGNSWMPGGPAAIASGWQRSPLDALGDLVIPLLTDPRFLLGAAIWAGIASLVGLLLVPLRSRLPGNREDTGTADRGSLANQPATGVGGGR